MVGTSGSGGCCISGAADGAAADPGAKYGCVWPGISPVSDVRHIISAWITASGATGSCVVASEYS